MEEITLKACLNVFPWFQDYFRSLLEVLECNARHNIMGIRLVLARNEFSSFVYHTTQRGTRNNTRTGKGTG